MVDGGKEGGGKIQGFAPLSRTSFETPQGAMWSSYGCVAAGVSGEAKIGENREIESRGTIGHK